MARIPTSGQIRAEDGSARKSIAAVAPRAAKLNSRRLRCEAVEGYGQRVVWVGCIWERKSIRRSAIPPMEITVSACRATEMEYT